MQEHNGLQRLVLRCVSDRGTECKATTVTDIGPSKRSSGRSDQEEKGSSTDDNIFVAGADSRASPTVRLEFAVGFLDRDFIELFFPADSTSGKVGEVIRMERVRPARLLHTFTSHERALLCTEALERCGDPFVHENSC